MKKNKLITQIVFTSLILLFSVTSCKKEFLDINENPNNPLDVEVEVLLPSAQAAIAHVMGNNLQIFGGFYAQYWTQSSSASQYKTIEQYSPAANDFDDPWRILYADALQDLKKMREKATLKEWDNYIAIAKILEAYTYQVLTDNWGRIPFSEALRAEEGLLSPIYDSQESVYNGIIKLLNDADGLIDESSDFVPGTDDLYFHGDMGMWRKFGNTLKLRVFLRLHYINPASDTAVQSLDGADFLAAGENVKLDYTSQGGNTNPLYSAIVEVGSTQNIVASATAIDYMLANSDARIDYLYVPTGPDYVGLPQGKYDTLVSFPAALPGAVTGANADDETSALASVILMSGYESLFLQAEGAARGLLSGSAKSLYEEAITENFASFGITDSTPFFYYTQPNIDFPTGGTTEDQIKRIITEKWIAMCGKQGNEAWIESRRTGYPDFFTVSANSLLGQVFPGRLLYPDNELTRNANFPGQPSITDKVWWDNN